MGAAAAAVGRGILRADERVLVATAGVVFALASGGAAMTAAAADAMFLDAIGPGQLGQAVALSNALLAVVLAVVGGLADRLERRRVLATLALVSAAVIAGLAAIATATPAIAAVVTLIVGKQLAAATDLAFWVVIAERIDARRSQRLLPLLAATGGAGAAAGSVLVVPLAAAAGARGVLVAAAGLLVLAAAGASKISATRRVAAPVAVSAGMIARSWRDGARAVRRHPLALHLAIVVGAAGVFGSLAYFALGVAVAGRGGKVGDLAQLLGGVRGAGQILTLAVQLLLARRILSRLGTGPSLLLAPLFALAAALGLVVAPILAIAIATQVSAKVLDAGIETPAEKLTQTLLPTIVRGRIGGFLDGTAKRAGAVLGGLVAALLVGSPTAFYAIMAVAAALWLLSATRIARELPALAVEHAADAHGDAARGASLAGSFAGAADVVDDRAITQLVRELDGPRPDRAADVLARLHERGRVDAVKPLAAAAIAHGTPGLWRALIAVLDQPATAHGPLLLEAAQAAHQRTRPLAVRAVGLAGGVPASAMEQWVASPAAAGGAGLDALALVAEVARRRLANEPLVEELADATRDGPASRDHSGDTASPSRGTAGIAIEELAIEVARGLARADEPHVLDAARVLVRALRRGRGDAGARTAGLAALARLIAAVRDRKSAELALLRADVLELVRERVEQGASQPAPEHALVSLMRAPQGAGRTAGGGSSGDPSRDPSGDSTDDAAEIAAALRLYGALLEGADVVEPDDLRRVARALGEPDDDVREAAEDALAALGPAAAGELIATAAWGRRRARDRAAALLADLPVTPATIDRLVDAELDHLEQTAAAITAFTEPGDELIVRRLEERLREIAHTVLLLVSARRRSRAIARAAVAWRHARAGQERARTLAVIEASLPRPLVGRLVEAVDDIAPADRAAALVRAGAELPSRDAAIRSELAGRDRLARALVLHALGASGRSAHRDVIARAASAEAAAASATDLLRRLTEAVSDPVEEGVDMPTRVETLIALGRVPLLAPLSTRQLADIAERARWASAKEGTVLVTAGDPIDALIVVEDGELRMGTRITGPGEVVDELACVAPATAPADLVVARSARVIRLERVDFEELVDDVPGLASAVCRALGDRARRGEDASYRSPLASRA
ncbi:MAG: cyclic nucleotide-binding domain-containing protein [Deltaproteobacteria bacterium]|nr:cyclic nucleotide-binding domain-containing protein [Deltaproteobacteria bacterium]